MFVKREKTYWNNFNLILQDSDQVYLFVTAKAFLSWCKYDIHIEKAKCQYYASWNAVNEYL